MIVEVLTQIYCLDVFELHESSTNFLENGVTKWTSVNRCRLREKISDFLRTDRVDD